MALFCRKGLLFFGSVFGLKVHSFVISSEVNAYNQSSVGVSDDWSDDQNDGSDNESGSTGDAIETDFEFPQLEQRINEILESFGSVFPKLNWSSCEDSQWISASGTRCRQSQDIYLLLKSSDRIVHDLTQPFKYCSDINDENAPNVEYELILKKWMDINPSMEFRCFVANNTLIAISQRDVRSYYYHIQQQKDDIIADIYRFFITHLKHKFDDNDFVFDTYRPNRGRVVLVDINPFGRTTDSLLFDWDELNAQRNNSSVEASIPEFRFLTNETGIQPQSYSMNALPIEVNYGYDLNDLMNGFRIDR